MVNNSIDQYQLHEPTCLYRDPQSEQLHLSSRKRTHTTWPLTRATGTFWSLHRAHAQRCITGGGGARTDLIDNLENENKMRGKKRAQMSEFVRRVWPFITQWHHSYWADGSVTAVHRTWPGTHTKGQGHGCVCVLIWLCVSACVWVCLEVCVTLTLSSGT